MPHKAQDISIRHRQILWFGGKEKSAFQKVGEKFASLAGLRQRADIFLMKQIGREKIKKDIRSLKPQSISMVVSRNANGNLPGSNFFLSINAKKVMSRKSWHKILL